VITSGVETPLEHISGLGLWLVKWIVEGMNGELTIETKESHGTIITLSFPPIEQAIENAETATQSESSQLETTVSSRENMNPIETTTRSDD